MTIIYGDLHNVAKAPTEGELRITSLETRSSTSDVGSVVTREPYTERIVGGSFITPDVEPGPALVEVLGQEFYQKWEVVVPDGESVVLSTLIAANYDWSPAEISAFEKLVSEATKASTTAGNAAAEAKQSEETVTRIMNDAVGTVRDKVRDDADRAEASKEQAATSAAEAAGARDRAEAAAAAAAKETSDGIVESLKKLTDENLEYSTQTALSASEAQASADEARGSASAAKSSAQTASQAVQEAKTQAELAGAHSNTAQGAQEAATAAQTGAEEARDTAEAAARVAAKEEISTLVGGASNDLDTIYELADAVRTNKDGVAAIEQALNNRVVGPYTIVVQDKAPDAGTPSNQITIVTA